VLLDPVPYVGHSDARCADPHLADLLGHLGDGEHYDNDESLLLDTGGSDSAPSIHHPRF